MSLCKVVYFGSAAAYLVAYFLGASWIHGPEDKFAWSRLVFLLATLLLLDKYALVPEPLTCPPFYTVYKMIVALLISNVALITLWWQIEDFIQWFMASLAALFQYVPMIKRKLGFGENATVINTVQLLMSLYFLFWVLMSKGFLQRLKGSDCPSATAATAATSQRPTIRRSKSKSRC